MEMIAILTGSREDSDTDDIGLMLFPVGTPEKEMVAAMLETWQYGEQDVDECHTWDSLTEEIGEVVWWRVEQRRIEVSGSPRKDVDGDLYDRLCGVAKAYQSGILTEGDMRWCILDVLRGSEFVLPAAPPQQMEPMEKPDLDKYGGFQR